MINFPSIFVPLVGLVFPAIAMASLFFMFKKQDFLDTAVSREKDSRYFLRTGSNLMKSP